MDIIQNNLAAKQAQEIVNRNNLIVQKLRENNVSHKEVFRVESYIEEREKIFSNLECEMDNNRKIKSGASLFTKFKESLFGH